MIVVSNSFQARSTQEKTMQTRALTIHVAPDAAQAYETATPEVQRQVDDFLSSKLREAMRDLNRQADGAPSAEFWEGRSLAELTAAQGGKPVESLDDLCGGLPEGELDGFEAAVRQWRDDELVHTK